MNHEDFKKFLTDKGYTPYLVDMFDKMLSDLQTRSGELGLLTGLSISVEVKL